MGQKYDGSAQVIRTLSDGVYSVTCTDFRMQDLTQLPTFLVFPIPTDFINFSLPAIQVFIFFRVEFISSSLSSLFVCAV